MEHPLNSREENVSSPALVEERFSHAILKSALAVLFGIGFGALAIRWTGVSLKDLRASFASAQTWKIIAATIGTFILSASQAVRWHCILKGTTNVSYITIFKSKIVGYAANCVLPARLGDLVRVEFVSALTGAPRSKILATGVVDLWFDKIGWMITFAIAFLIAPMPSWVLQAMLVMSAIIFVIGIALALFTVKARNLKPDSFLAKFREGLSQPHLGKLAFAQLFYSPLSWVWETLMIVFVASAFGVDLNFAQAFAVLTAMNVSMVVPIPGNAGAFEVASTYVLTAFGVAPERAVAFSVAYHLIFLVPGVIAGAAIFSANSSEFQFFQMLKRAYGTRSAKGSPS
ncbi:MAG: flippase-like domain-containing protein [Cryobacterium sp.]|nr:flippase-like domain-containing protein [Oligoflexia bacterium]